MTPNDRRQFPRVEAEVFYRPAGLAFMHHRYNTRNVSLGGMRALSDERMAVESRLELDVILADDSVVRCWATVVWIEELAAGAEARFEIGLKFTDLAKADIQRLASVLNRATDR